MRYEYQETPLALLNDAGQLGWEAFAIVSRPGLTPTAWCKRPILEYARLSVAEAPSKPLTPKPKGAKIKNSQ